MVVGQADELYIQPIQVCDDRGQNCAGVNIFADITAKILEQAKLKVSFLPTNRLNASRFLSINDSKNRSSSEYEFYELTRTGEKGAFGRHPDSTQRGGPINVWFVNTIEAINGFTQYGLAWVDANGVVISSEVKSFGPNGRTDTVAHEVSHNLGLRHSTSGGDDNNLLTDGDSRNIPSSVADIGSDGGGLSKLTNSQIATLKNSSFLTTSKAGVVPTELEAADAQLIAGLSDAALANSGNLADGDTRRLASAGASFSAAKAEHVSVPEPNSSLALLGLGLFLLTLTQRSSTAQSQVDGVSR